MKVAVFSTEAYDREFLTATNADVGHDLTFYEPRLTAHTCALAAGFPAICVCQRPTRRSGPACAGTGGSAIGRYAVYGFQQR